MAILWCGGEDIDFPNGAVPTVDLGITHFRTAYARCGLLAVQPTVVKGTIFPGGAITSCWLSCRMFTSWAGANSRSFGLGVSGSNKGLFVGPGTAASTICLSTFDGTTRVVLASELGTSMSATVHKIDIQLVNWGASATIRVYVDGALLITFTGNSVGATGIASFDSVFIPQPNTLNATFVSEVIVADEDTRDFSLSTLAPSAAGTTDDWTGAFTDVNEVTINDVTVVTTDTPGLDEQFNLTNLTAGSFQVRNVKIVARSANTVGSAVNTVALGVNVGGTVDPGAPQAVTTAFVPLERFMSQNPVTAANWTQTEADALQVNLRSGA